MNRVRRAAALASRPLAASAAIAAAVYAVFPHGFANYDALYTLVWGQQLGRGETPQYDLPIAPTPHPLAELVGLVLSPLSGAHAEDAMVVVAYLALGALGYLLFRLGSLWFSWQVGRARGAPVPHARAGPLLRRARLRRLPYLAFVLGALLVETRRPRAGAPVLVLLGLAGLLRPEAWLFSAAYVAWLARETPPQRSGATGRPRGGRRPCSWALSDLLVTGNPLWSLTKTRDTAETLHRVTGLDDVPTVMPRRIGEILREPVLVAAAGGGVLSLAWLASRGHGSAPRPASPPSSRSASSPRPDCRSLPATSCCPRRSWRCSPAPARWAGRSSTAKTRGAGGDGCSSRLSRSLLLVAFTPSQVDRLQRTSHALDVQQRIRDDLGDLAASGAVSTRCGPIAVPNHRPVPLLAARLEVAARAASSARRSAGPARAPT